MESIIEEVSLGPGCADGVTRGLSPTDTVWSGFDAAPGSKKVDERNS